MVLLLPFRLYDWFIKQTNYVAEIYARNACKGFRNASDFFTWHFAILDMFGAWEDGGGCGGLRGVLEELDVMLSRVTCFRRGNMIVLYVGSRD